ncbi:CAP-Gly domain-containing linker protein 1-like [Mugil cephalus]|uniref:CAP-Gly domain-containing linker protein 1-like n=1 Tax=Mugil cephalus TaxID=48193 RepID=UPI001FB80B55|nr:CAP-Gly domain-containing linker protein 1-like [Mugil cephalus]
MERENIILRDQVKWLQDSLDTNQKSWTETIKDLTSEIEDLKYENARLNEKVEEGKKREEELVTVWDIKEKDFKDALETLELTSQVTNDTITVDLGTKLAKCRTYYKETVKELREQLETVTADANKYQKKSALLEEKLSKIVKEHEARAQKDAAETKSHYEKQVEKLRQQLHQTEVNYKFDVVRLEADIKLQKDIIDQLKKDNAFVDAKIRGKCGPLEDRIGVLESDLKIRNSQLLNMAQKAEETKLFIAKLNKEIKGKASENFLLTKQRRDVQAQIVKERDKSASFDCQITELKVQVAKLEDTIEEQEKKEKEISDKLLMLQIQHKDQTKKFDRVSLVLRSKVPEAVKMKEKISHMETYQLRFKEHLQDCVDLINYPNKLKKAVIKLRNMYLKDTKETQDEIQIPTFLKQIEQETKIHDLTEKVGRYEVIAKSQSHQIKRLEAQIQMLRDDRTQKISSFVDSLNKERRTSHELMKTVKAQTLLLKKATKPMHQKVGSWINKKVLNNAPPRAPAEVPEEEPRQLRVEDFPQPVLPTGDEAAPTAPFSSPASSPSTDQLHSEHRLIQVKPRVDDALPPVES